jgi:hypothetical protein
LQKNVGFSKLSKKSIEPQKKVDLFMIESKIMIPAIISERVM